MSAAPRPTVARPSDIRGIVAATLGFAVGVLGPTITAFVAIAWSIENECREPSSLDCSWGLAYLLLIPVIAVGFLVIGPLGCVLALAIAGLPRTWATAWRCVVLVLCLPVVTGLVGYVLSFVSSSQLVGLAQGYLPLSALVAVPMLARAWAMWRWTPAPQPDPAPRTSTWDSPARTTPVRPVWR